MTTDASGSDDPDQVPTDPDGLDALLDHVRRQRGFDVTGYKRATIGRRVGKRLQALGLTSYRDYIDQLEVDPAEYQRLFDTVLINVTRFQRDAEAWRSLQEDVLPLILRSKTGDEPVRVWSAGCSTGQETYSVAIALAEVLGVDAFQDRVKIYGTDIDEPALAVARHATYSEEELEAFDPELRDRYFRPASEVTPVLPGATGPDDGWTFRPDLRRTVIFGEHNVVSDAPISRLDLLVCRNTLMYFNADVQAHVLKRFHFALRPNGVLFLGKAEKLLSHNHPFEPIDGTRRFFRKVAGAAPQRLLDVDEGRERAVDHVMANLGLRDATFDVGPVAKLAIDPAGHLVTANEPARSMFRLTARDLGRPLRDLELSYRPTDLRGAIDQAEASGQPVQISDVPWQAGLGDDRVLDVAVVPLGSDDGPLGTAITFLDVTDRARLRHDVEVVSQQLDTAYEELQASHEELETTNEELQSTVEELETTNEELQSTNEELETMNEELQSTNDELHATNDELSQRRDELREVNDFLGAVLTGINRGVVVLDPDLIVRVWNDQAEELWGLREDEVQGRNFLNLDIGLPVDDLREILRQQLTGDGEVAETELSAHDRRGRQIRCHVTSSPMRTPHGDVQGVIMLMQAREPATS